MSEKPLDDFASCNPTWECNPINGHSPWCLLLRKKAECSELQREVERLRDKLYSRIAEVGRLHAQLMELAAETKSEGE